MELLPGQRWYRSHRADPRAVALYLRHYSAKHYADGRARRQFVGPGEDMVLLTPTCDALFVWTHNTIARLDGQLGVNCAVFRNEGPHLSSDLIREAEQLAWTRWPGERLFTYVDAGKVRRKRDPGRCFIRAGWNLAGKSKGGLLLFEKLPENG